MSRTLVVVPQCPNADTRGSYYKAYLKFFTDVLMERGPAGTFEKFIFSPKYNIEPPKNDQAPMAMTNRFLSGLLHPLIHTGYGAEFGLGGMFAEGSSGPKICSLITIGLLLRCRTRRNGRAQEDRRHAHS